MRRSLGLIALFMAAVAFAQPAPGQRPEEAAAAAWMKAAAVDLDGDLAPFGGMVGSARIAALGEATCGAHELFDQKRRLIEYLVARKGFTVLAMAASFPDALAINEYVLDGNGDPSAALAALGFWKWNSDEVLDLLLWMRAWNADPSHTRKLKFYGLEMQHTPATVARLRKALGGEATAALDALTPLEKRYGYAALPSADRQRVVAAIKALQKLAAEDHSANGELTRQEVTLLRQAEEVFREPLGAGDRREPRMAANLKWILEHEPAGTKAVPHPALSRRERVLLANLESSNYLPITSKLHCSLKGCQNDARGEVTFWHPLRGAVLGATPSRGALVCEHLGSA